MRISVVYLCGVCCFYNTRLDVMIAHKLLETVHSEYVSQYQSYIIHIFLPPKKRTSSELITRAAKTSFYLLAFDMPKSASHNQDMKWW